MYVTKEQIRKARSVSLADYLLAKYSADVEIVGTSLRLKKNHSVYVKRNIPGYHDFATKEHGNSIDFLTRYKNYSFTHSKLSPYILIYHLNFQVILNTYYKNPLFYQKEFFSYYHINLHD